MTAETEIEAEMEVDTFQRWLTFQLGEEIFGLNVMSVQEVLRMTPVAEVPGSPFVCLGVINLRGHIVPVLDLRRLLKLPEVPDTESTRMVIVDYLDEAVALRVDRVGEVFSVADKAVEEAPAVGNSLTRGQIKGVVRRGSRIFVLLQAPELMSAAASKF